MANDIPEVGDQPPPQSGLRPGGTSEVSIFSSAAADYREDSENHPGHLVARLAFILGGSAILMLLRWIDPMVAGRWLPFHPSCGAITGLPCIFCGMTRALHLLLNGDFSGAIYFNWLAFPVLAVVIFLIALFAIEVLQRRVIWRLGVVLPMTRRRLTVLGLGLLLLWTLQAYLAVSQHKHELLNSRGPLYALFVR